MLKELNGNVISFCAVIIVSSVAGTLSSFPKAGGFSIVFVEKCPF
jgi:hypothetical protein